LAKSLPDSQLATRIAHADLILWDEISSLKKESLEELHRTLCVLKKSTKPFGGLLIVFGGDFCQIPPVVKHGTLADVASNSGKSSFLWQSITELELPGNIRIQHELQDTLLPES
jgi:hypothetical protein